MTQNKKVFLNFSILPMVVLVLLIAAAILYISRGYICSRLVVPDIVEWESPSQKTDLLYGDREVRQYFKPHFNGLFRIGFRAQYLEPMDAKIVVALREADRDLELFREVIPLKRFPNNKIRRFSFSPLWDSAGKEYYLNISVRDAFPETGLKLFYSSWIFFHTHTKGDLYFCDRKLSGELSMASECRTRINRAGFVCFWQNFLADRGFALFYIMAAVVICITICYFLLQKETSQLRIKRNS